MHIQEFSLRPAEGPLSSRGIRPLTLDAVQHIHAKDLSMAQQITHGQNDENYRPVRLADRLLTPSRDYAELPGFAGQPARHLLQALPTGAHILDVGCADGGFGREIVDTINSEVHVHGFDARAIDIQKTNLTDITIGSVYDLSRSHFPSTNFDVVMSSALVYHLGDPLLGMVRMANVVDTNGLLILSTLPRIIQDGKIQWVETDQTPIPPTNSSFRYYGGNNYYDSLGRLIPSRELASLLGQKLGFTTEYGVASAPISGADMYGGQLSGRKNKQPDNSIQFFYCQTDGDQLPGLWKDRLGYIVAHTDEEAMNLQSQGYMPFPV